MTKKLQQEFTSEEEEGTLFQPHQADTIEF
jgi:hypothetical protein